MSKVKTTLDIWRIGNFAPPERQPLFPRLTHGHPNARDTCAGAPTDDIQPSAKPVVQRRSAGWSFPGNGTARAVGQGSPRIL
jgi:hypothetical protein